MPPRGLSVPAWDAHAGECGAALDAAQMPLACPCLRVSLLKPHHPETAQVPQADPGAALTPLPMVAGPAGGQAKGRTEVGGVGGWSWLQG